MAGIVHSQILRFTIAIILPIGALPILFFYNSKLGHVCDDRIEFGKLTIENDVWIGDGVVILPSVSHIGNGAVIGARAVVTKNVPPFAVVVGNPGHIVRFRFSENLIRSLQSTQWWMQDIAILKKRIIDFQGTLPDSKE